MYLIVGLGNPGPRYGTTRHNIGWRVVIHLAHQWSVGLVKKGSAQRGTGRLGGQSVTLALPLAWMNQTGEVVRTLVYDLDVSHETLIVVHDDLDLETGRIRIKSGGGSGGHNGLRSLIAALDTDEFVRLKVGIGRPPEAQAASDYVLSPFSSSESSIIQEMLDRAVEALECLVIHGVPAAMNQFNIRKRNGEDV